MTGFGVYVHIPFCSKRCDYCAFATWTDKEAIVDDYVDAVVAHIEREIAAGMPIADTVFFGGGTPTLIDPHHIARIACAIPKIEDAEVTVECNPDNVTAELMAVYAEAGVNRVSIGVQSTVPHVLAALGREHDRANVQRAVEHSRDAGITNINLDLIYGAHGESLEDWHTTLSDAVALQPTHVSAYGLTVEAGTPLAADESRHPDDDDQADKYVMADEALTALGLVNYEISNWSIPGLECKHNTIYWEQGNYAAFGCAAHGHRDGRRWWNIRTPDRYIASIQAGDDGVGGFEELDGETRAREQLELSLRTSQGVPVGTLDIDDLGDLVEIRAERVVLTRPGRLLANEVSLRLNP